MGWAGLACPVLRVNNIMTPAAIAPIFQWPTKAIPLSVKDRPVNLQLNFEVFNVSNSWSPTCTVGRETYKGLLTLSAAHMNRFADGGFPDGTQARRLQVSARISF